MKIAIFLPNWIGDAVMATPAMRAVRTEFPSAEIVAVARPYVADVLAGLDLLDRVILHNPRGRAPRRHDRQLRGWRFVQALRNEHFDIALLLPNSLRSGWNAWMSGAKRRVGFARNGRGWMLTDPVKPRSKKQPHPALDEYLRLAQQLGCEQVSHRMELATLPEDERRLSEFWSQQFPENQKTVGWPGLESLRNPGERGTGTALRSSPGHPNPLPQTVSSRNVDRQPANVVCLNPGGAFGAAKHWPTESFGKLAARIADEMGKTVLVLCGPAERDEARDIVRHANHQQVTSLADVEPSIGLTKAAVKHAQLLVTTDSGPRHFAAPFGVPVVTLFGPTHIAWSETHYPQAVHLQHPVDCGPCQQRVCPLKHHRCMRDLTVDRVFNAVVNSLRTSEKSVA